MCDEIDLKSFEKIGLDRRRFASLTAVAGLGAALPACATAQGDGAAGGVTSTDVNIATPDGTMDAVFVHPATGKHPAVIIWTDIAGQRPAFRVMAERLAGAGYAVLLTNPFYRHSKAPQFQDFADFQAKGGFQMVGPWRAALTPEAIGRDATALIGWLDRQAAVDTAKGVGTQGYCMGGPLTVWTAAGVPGRVKAAASFHGGGLVAEGDTAPINLFDDTKGTRYLIAIAKNDDARAPDEKTKLRAAADAAGTAAEIEVYQGDHGWTVADSPVYNQAEAERAWARLLATYAKL